MLNKIKTRRGGFTLVEIMIVVAIIALLAALAVPGFLRARKRSQATTCLNNLRLIDAAKDQYATDTGKTSIQPDCFDLQGYFKTSSMLYNAVFNNTTATSFQDGKIQNTTYYLNDTSNLPSIDTAGGFSDVVDSTFWSPYSSN